jgi:hypothetical protein
MGSTSCSCGQTSRVTVAHVTKAQIKAPDIHTFTRNPIDGTVSTQSGVNSYYTR